LQIERREKRRPVPAIDNRQSAVENPGNRFNPLRIELDGIRIQVSGILCRGVPKDL
jgi:hypothetical protein